MKIWLDDIKLPPDDSWDCVCKTYHETCFTLLHYRKEITHISFDYDLGERFTGADVAKFIEHGARLGKLRRIYWYIHSPSNSGSVAIRMAMTKADEYWNFDDYDVE